MTQWDEFFKGFIAGAIVAALLLVFAGMWYAIAHAPTGVDADLVKIQRQRDAMRLYLEASK